jgi:hypothetical protein
MVDTNLSDQNKFVGSDYVTDLYVAGHLMWQSKRIVHSKLAEGSKVSLTLVTALLLLPLTSPHLLYYDFCMFLPVGVILLENKYPLPQGIFLNRVALTGWISISLYALLFLNVTANLALPLALLAILLVLFLAVLRCVNKISLGSASLLNKVHA